MTQPATTTRACDECGTATSSVARLGAVALCDACRSAASTPAPLYEKAICYDAEVRDFAMYLDGELVGFARTYADAETTLDELVYELLARHLEVIIGSADAA